MIGIDQRGLGRSLPSVAIKPCAASVDNLEMSADPEMSLRFRLRAWEDRTKACWEDPSFQLTGSDGTSYHWLQHSGTTQLVGDINLLRKAIGAKKLSFHTVSYGTQIAGLYATMYPDHVDKLVLDSNTLPTPDGFKWSWDLADAKEKAWNRMAMVCDMMPDCPLPNGVEASLKLIKATVDKEPQHNVTFTSCNATVDISSLAVLQGSMHLTFWNSGPFGYLSDIFQPDVRDPSAVKATLESLGLAARAIEGGDLESFWRVIDAGIEENSGPVVCMGQMMDQIMQSALLGNATDSSVGTETGDGGGAHARSLQEASTDGSAKTETAVGMGIVERLVWTIQRNTNATTNDTVRDPLTWFEPTLSVAVPVFGVAGQPDYHEHASLTAPSIINAEDTINYAETEDLFVLRWKQAKENFPCMGLESCTDAFIVNYMMGYKWPSAVPYTPIGNPDVRGMVLGQLYDPSTPYAWTQEVKLSFPRTAMVTSQDVRHGADISDVNVRGGLGNFFFSGKEEGDAAAADITTAGNTTTAHGHVEKGLCFGLITTYLMTNKLPYNGFVCGNPLPAITGMLEKSTGTGTFEGTDTNTKGTKSP